MIGYIIVGECLMFGIIFVGCDMSEPLYFVSMYFWGLQMIHHVEWR